MEVVLNAGTTEPGSLLTLVAPEISEEEQTLLDEIARRKSELQRDIQVSKLCSWMT